MASSSSKVEVVDKASCLSSVARQALERIQIDASMILPTLDKCAELDRKGQSPPCHLWIVVYSAPGRVGFVLACTDGYMGPYPIFIVNPNALNDEDFVSGLQLLARTLHRNVPKERVYSIFSLIKISQLFSKMWTQLTGIQIESQPYYDAKISSLRWHDGLQQPLTTSEASMFEVGPAGPADIMAIAKLGHAFASDSPPFTLTEEAAIIEAKKLVSNRQVWTHKYKGKIVSVAAFTRNTRQVATITKVYTDPECRGHGCAERLVRHLCNSLLQDRGREAVVLFVGCENRASRVYRRVGFQGLDTIVNGSIDNVDRWLEVGFDRRKVTLGHW